MRPFAQSEPTPTRRTVTFKLVDRTDNLSPELGIVLSIPSAEVQVSKNGAAFGNAAGVAAELGGGFYSYEFTPAELDTLGSVRLKIDDAAAAIVVAEYQVRAAVDVYADLYDGAVWIDFSGGGAGGTVIGVNGTRANPVATFTDARTIADGLGVRHYKIRLGASIPTITAAHDNWLFEGIGGQRQQGHIGLSAVSLRQTRFVDLAVSGPASDGGATVSELFMERCRVFGLTAVKRLHLDNCTLTDQGAGANAITFANSPAGSVTPLILRDCSFVPIALPSGNVGIVMPSTVPVEVFGDGCRGQVAFRSSTHASNRVNLGMHSGRVVVEGTNTAGFFALSGIFELEWLAAQSAPLSADLTGWYRFVDEYTYEGERAVFVIGSTVAADGFAPIPGVHGTRSNPLTGAQDASFIGDAIRAEAIAVMPSPDPFTALLGAPLQDRHVIGVKGTILGGATIRPVVDITDMDMLGTRFRDLDIVHVDPSTPPAGAGTVFENCRIGVSFGSAPSSGEVGFGASTELLRCELFGRIKLPPVSKFGPPLLFMDECTSVFGDVGLGGIMRRPDAEAGFTVEFILEGPALIVGRQLLLSTAIRRSFGASCDLNFRSGSRLLIDASNGQSHFVLSGDCDLVDDEAASDCVIDRSRLRSQLHGGANIRHYALTFFGHAHLNLVEAARLGGSSPNDALKYAALVVQARSAGAAGNAITVEVVNDGEPLGVRAEEIGNAVIIHTDGSATAGGIAIEINSVSTLIEVRTYQALSFDPVPDIPATNLIGGADGAGDASNLYISESLPSEAFRGARVLVYDLSADTVEERIVKQATQAPTVAPIGPPETPSYLTRGRMRLELETPLSFTPRWGDRCAIRLDPDAWSFENTLLDNQQYVQDGPQQLLVAARLRKFATAAAAAAATKGAVGLEGALKAFDVEATPGPNPGEPDLYRVKKQ